jgi:hypothetical protein
MTHEIKTDDVIGHITGQCHCGAIKYKAQMPIVNEINR